MENSVNYKNLKIKIENKLYFETAKKLAEKLSVDIISNSENIENSTLCLNFSFNGIMLEGQGNCLKVDFNTMLNRIKKENLHREMLIKAAKLKNFLGTPKLVDATAGFGEDSFLLAAYGFDVTMIEKNLIIYTLLNDALYRVNNLEKINEIIKKMNLIQGDSIFKLNELNFCPDVILLDPMFPERKKTGLIKKKFQLLQQLEKPCLNENELLNSAINSKPKKIVIKRPIKAPFLANVKPNYSLYGSTIRYDCLVF